MEQENSAFDVVRQASPIKQSRNLRSFISPARVLSPRPIGNNINLGQRASMNEIFSRPEKSRRPAMTRESVRRTPTEDVYHSRNEESYLNSRSNASVINSVNISTKKKIIVFKKLLSKSPERKVPVIDVSKHLITDATKFLNNFSTPKQPTKTKVCLNEMITLKKVRETKSNGIIKRMFHAPSLNIYEVHVC